MSTEYAVAALPRCAFVGLLILREALGPTKPGKPTVTARRTDVHRIQELIRLHRPGSGARALSRTLKMGRETVRHCVTALRDAGLLDGDATDLPKL